MVRSVYNFNRVFPQGTDFRLAFTFTGDGGFFGGAAVPDQLAARLERVLPGSGRAAATGQRDRREPVRPAHDRGDPAPTRPSSIPLARLNLLRSSRHYKLPTGQAVAARMKHAAADQGPAPESERAARSSSKFDIGRHTPLWFYLLKEAEVKTGGEHLGPAGAAIVAEVIIGCSGTTPRACSATRRARCCLRPTAPSRSATCSTSSRSTRASRTFRRRASSTRWLPSPDQRSPLRYGFISACG